MKKFLVTLILCLLLSENAYSKTTNLICKFEKDDTEFTILIDANNSNATWKDKIVQAEFSASAVTFVVAMIGKKDNFSAVMQYEINRINLEVVETLTMKAPGSSDIKDEIISISKGKCRLGKKLKLIF